MKRAQYSFAPGERELAVLVTNPLFRGLDRDGMLSSRLNASMVEVYDLSRKEYADELKAMLTRHAEWTRSEKAQRILESFDAWLPFFRMVIPTEYRLLLERR